MRGIDNAEVRQQVGTLLTLNPEVIKKRNEEASKAPRKIEGYVRDWELLKDWTMVGCTEELTREGFFACMEVLIGRKSASRIENFRSAIAFRQKADLPNKFQWSQDAGFLDAFKGLVKRANMVFRAKQEAGEIRHTKRGSATIRKVKNIMDWCETHGEKDYGCGFWLAYHALLRHGELIDLTAAHMRHTTEGVAQIKIVGGKGLPIDHVQWVTAEGCAQLVQELMKRRGFVFPKWDEKRANVIIQATAVAYGWDEDVRWVMHSTRRGGATDMKRDGKSIFDIMETGEDSD